MKVLYVLPIDIYSGTEFQLQAIDIYRGIKCIMSVCKEDTEVCISAPPDQVSFYSSLLIDREIYPYAEYDSTQILAYDIVAFHDSEIGEELQCWDNGDYSQIRDWLAGELNDNKPQLYRISRSGSHMIFEHNFQGGLTEKAETALKTHYFNQTSMGCSQGPYYYPYGFLYRHVGQGPTNPMGFRYHKHTDCQNRQKNHKVIAVFGGGAARGYYVHDDEVFSYLLEAKLNDYCTEQNGLHFSVVNFGQPGYCILSELTAYLMFCNKLKPDIVITHSGVNDFLFGLQSDSYLLKQFDYTYLPKLEGWAQKIHGTGPVALERQNNAEYSEPHSIINAYYTRLIQFQNIVNGRGAIFIAGLQPTVFSKNAMSSREKLLLAVDQLSLGKRKDFSVIIKKLYEDYIQLIAHKKLENFADVHSYFGRFGREHSLFADDRHTYPSGDIAIAEYYFDYITRYVMTKIL